MAFYIWNHYAFSGFLRIFGFLTFGIITFGIRFFGKSSWRLNNICPRAFLKSWKWFCLKKWRTFKFIAASCSSHKTFFTINSITLFRKLDRFPMKEKKCSQLRKGIEPAKIVCKFYRQKFYMICPWSLPGIKAFTFTLKKENYFLLKMSNSPTCLSR